MATIGDRIKALRIAHKMSQEELGQRLGINRAAVNKYEKGTVINIPTNTILKLCSIFDVTPNYLLLGQTEFEIQDIIKEIQRELGNSGVKCFTMLQRLSEEGLTHTIPYLEDMLKLYPAEIATVALTNTEAGAGVSPKYTDYTNIHYSIEHPVESLPLTNRTKNLLCRNHIFTYGELLNFYTLHSVSTLPGAGKNIADEIKQFMMLPAPTAIEADCKSVSIVTVEQAYPESRFKAFREYCEENNITNYANLNHKILLDFLEKRTIGLGYIIRVYVRHYVLLNCSNANSTFEIFPETLSAPINILKFFRSDDKMLRALRGAAIFTMKEFSDLELLDIRRIIGEYCYAENYDLFRFLQFPLNTIFELIFPFVEADSNWKSFSEYCDNGAMPAVKNRNITRQRIYQHVDKIRDRVTPIVSEIIKNEIRKSGTNSIEVSKICALFHGKLSTKNIRVLLRKDTSLKTINDKILLIEE